MPKAATNKDILSRAEKLNLNTDCYSIWGSSAGGHLAASFGTKAMGYANYHLPKPGALVLCYSVVTMGDKTHLGSRNNLLGEAPDGDMIALASVERQVTPASPPTFLWCGEAEHVVDPKTAGCWPKNWREAMFPIDLRNTRASITVSVSEKDWLAKAGLRKP